MSNINIFDNELINQCIIQFFDMNEIIIFYKLFNIEKYKLPIINIMFKKMILPYDPKSTNINFILPLLNILTNIKSYISGGYLLKIISNTFKLQKSSFDIDIFISKKELNNKEEQLNKIFKICEDKRIAYIYYIDNYKRKIISSPDIYKVLKIKFIKPYLNEFNDLICSMDIVIISDDYNPEWTIKNFDIGICSNYITSKNNIYIPHMKEIVNSKIETYNMNITHIRYNHYMKILYKNHVRCSFFKEYIILMNIIKKFSDYYFKYMFKDSDYSIKGILKIEYKYFYLPINLLFGKLITKNILTRSILIINAIYQNKYISGIDNKKLNNIEVIPYNLINKQKKRFTPKEIDLFEIIIVDDLIYVVYGNMYYFNFSDKDLLFLDGILDIFCESIDIVNNKNNLFERRKYIISLLLKNRSYNCSEFSVRLYHEYVSTIYKHIKQRDMKKCYFNDEKLTDEDIDYLKTYYCYDELFMTESKKKYGKLYILIKTYILYETIKHAIIMFNTIYKQFERILKYKNKKYEIDKKVTDKFLPAILLSIDDYSNFYVKAEFN